MDKTKSDFKRFIKIILNPMLLIFILLILNIFTILMLREFNKQKDYELNLSQNLLSKINDSYDKKLNELSIIEEKISMLKNIDNHISAIKEDFFKNAFEYESLVLQGKGTKKIAYLTIDDGPYSYTRSFLDIFDQYDIFSTFFLLGKSNNAYDATYKRIAESGHTIGNHTFSHAIKTGLYTNVDSFIDDVLKQEDFLVEKTGIKTNILRFPGGSRTASYNYRQQILLRLRTLNYGYIDWNVSTGDAEGNPTVETAYTNVINGIRNKNIVVILMHDFSKSSLLALPSIIEELKARDYIFLPLFYESNKIIK